MAQRQEQQQTEWTEKVQQAARSYQQLQTLAPQLQQARTELRTLAESIAGCSLQEWPIADVERYLDLFCIAALEQLGQREQC